MATAVAAISHVQADVSELKENTNVIRSAIDLAMVGSEASPGLLIRVDRLQQKMRLMQWVLGVTTTAVVGELARLIFQWLNGVHP